jgi:hypothetical protein
MYSSTPIEHKEPFLASALGLSNLVELNHKLQRSFTDSLIHSPTDDSIIIYKESRLAEQLSLQLTPQEILYFATRYVQSKLPIGKQVNIEKTKIFRRIQALPNVPQD